MRRSALHAIATTCALVLFSGVTSATQQNPEEITVAFDELSTTAMLAGLAASFVFFGLIAAVLIHLTPEYTRSTNQHMRDEPITTALIGFGTVIGVFIVSLVLILTFIGALVGIPLLLALVLVSFVGAVLVDILIGRFLLAEFAGRTERPPSTKTLWLAFLVGFVVTAIGTSIPVAGGLIALIVSSLGIGAMVQQFRKGSALSDGTPEDETWESSSTSSSWDDPEPGGDAGWGQQGEELNNWESDDTASDNEWGADDESVDDRQDDDRSW